MGVFVEPNGNVHDVGSESHWEWADKYLQNLERRFADDPIEELIRRGWMRVIFSPNESLIMVMTGSRRNSYLTRQQKEYLEDESEETSWAVKDDDGYVIYTPIDCNTPEEFLREWEDTSSSHNQVFPPTSRAGYSHGATSDYGDVQLERDPLNDPRLTGKKPFKESTFKFKDFNWMKRGDGFGMPIDVYYGTILIGVITTEPGYYEVSLIKGPTKHDDVPIKKDKKNQFKTKELAARAVHLMWKLQRSQPSEQT